MRAKQLAVPRRRLVGHRILAAIALCVVGSHSISSDQSTAPTVSADPRADIEDLFAWIAYDGRHLNLAMTIASRELSQNVHYRFHVDSGLRFAETSATTQIMCRFVAANAVDCRVGEVDSAYGDAHAEKGIEGRNRRFRVFAGPRDTSRAGGPHAALVISIDLDVVNSGGTMLAVWASTVMHQKQIDRVGRSLGSEVLTPEIERLLGLCDAINGACADQLLADQSADSQSRYDTLASLLADDRLWIDSESTICGQFLSLELAHLVPGQSYLRFYCGGRTPNDAAVDVYRSLLVDGTMGGIDAGSQHDEPEHSISEFPFLVRPLHTADHERF